MLKYRLLLGTLMIVGFVGLMLLDGGYCVGASCPLKGHLLMLLIAIVAIPANFEFAALAKSTGHKVFLPITVPVSILIAVWPYFAQTFGGTTIVYVIGMAIVICALLMYQSRAYGVTGVIGNCGASLFAIAYLGFLCSFIMLLRVQHGVLALLMFVFTIKSADIGAYAIGRLFGRHKFSPVISPGKTWEGMAGAVVFAAIVGSLFAHFFGTMAIVYGMVFGAIFAFIGQLGDLAESMLKRDAQQKDSSHTVPGFGGILDVIDSPLVAAPFAVAYFWLIHRWN